MTSTILIDNRKQKILNHIHFEKEKYGTTLAETIAENYIDLCKPVGSGDYKNILYLASNDIQLGDIYLHGSKISFIKSRHPNSNIYVMSKKFHFDLIPLYQRIKGVTEVFDIRFAHQADQLISDKNIDLVIYNRGEVFHNEIKYFPTESIATHDDIRAGFNAWCSDTDILQGGTRQRYLNGKPNLVCHLRNSMNCPERNYSMDQWHKTLQGLDQYFNIMLIGHPTIDHINQNMSSDIFFGIKHKIVPLRLSVDLFRILSNARFFIGPDTGPLHMAASFKYMTCIDLINTNSYWGFMPSYNEHYSVMAKSMGEIDPEIPRNIVINCLSFSDKICENRKYRIRSKYWEK